MQPQRHALDRDGARRVERLAGEELADQPRDRLSPAHRNHDGHFVTRITRKYHGKYHVFRGGSTTYFAAIYRIHFRPHINY